MKFVIVFVAFLAVTYCKPAFQGDYPGQYTGSENFEGYGTSESKTPDEFSGFSFGNEESNPFGSIDMSGMMKKIAELQQQYVKELESAKPTTRCGFCNTAVAYTAIAHDMLNLPKSTIVENIRRACKSLSDKSGDICDLAVNNIDKFISMTTNGDSSTQMCELIGVMECQPPKPTGAQKEIADMMSGMMSS